MLLVHQDTTYLVEYVLGRFGYMIALIVALHHAKPAVAASSRSGIRIVNVP